MLVKTLSSSKEQPMLILDVNIDNDSSVSYPLEVFGSDLAEPRDLVARFSQKHRLPKGKQRKLLRILKDNLEGLKHGKAKNGELLAGKAFDHEQSQNAAGGGEEGPDGKGRPANAATLFASEEGGQDVRTHF